MSPTEAPPQPPSSQASADEPRTTRGASVSETLLRPDSRGKVRDIYDLGDRLLLVASDRGGPAEIITHEQNGLLVKPEDPAAIARAVVNLAQNRDLANRIRHAAIATVRERYSLDKVGDQVEAYLKTVLATYRRNET